MKYWEMITTSNHCKQDGGFIGEGGCTHPNHQHSALVIKITGPGDPEALTVSEGRAALTEGFYVSTKGVKGEAPKKVAFGQRLLDHIEKDHNTRDRDRRFINLHFAVKTVKAGKRSNNKNGKPGTYAYAMKFPKVGLKMLVTTDPRGTVEEVYNIFPR